MDRSIRNPLKLLLTSVVCAAVSVAMWYPLARHNLPVAANVDERIGLAVLTHFHNGDLNPHFFFYPTLYYYLDYALTAWFGYRNLLFTGRLLNLILVGAVAAAAYFLAIAATRRRLAGWTAAALIVTSPLLAGSGGYLNTDVLLAWSTAMSLAFFVCYFRSRLRADWIYGMVLCGVAVGCKYTALVLFLAYGLTELVTPMPDATDTTWLSRSRVSRMQMVGVMLAGAVMCGLIAALFPVEKAVFFIQHHRTNVNMKAAADYVPFFHALRRKLAMVSMVLLALASCTARFEAFYKKIAPARLYLGLSMVVGILVVATPFGLVTPVKFVYDAGALLKNNVGADGGGPQWSNYFHWYLASESWAIGLLAIVGGVLLLRQWRSWGVLYAYILLYGFTIGAAYRGFPRYLPALLPALFCFSGYTLSLMVERRWGRWTASACLACVVCWHGIHVMDVRKQSAERDDSYRAYATVLSAHPRQVYYAGDAPFLELEMVGYSAQQISWQEAASASFWAGRGCGELVMLNFRDRDARTTFSSAALDSRLGEWRPLSGTSHKDEEEVYLNQPCR